MAANWQGQPGQGQYPYHPSTGYQQPQQLDQQQAAGYDAAAYQQYYAQYYAAQQQQQQQQAWAQYYQQNPQQAWPQGQYPQHYAQQYPNQPTPQALYQSVPIATQPIVQATAHSPPQPPVQQTPTQPIPNQKAPSCYNCGAQDHWAPACPQPSNSGVSATASNTFIKSQGQGKGPVVTKYAVPPHVLAQMKARGVTGTVAVTPVAAYPQSGYQAGNQYPGWQQWQAQASQQPAVSGYPQQYVQGAPAPWNQYPTSVTGDTTAQATVPPVSVSTQAETSEAQFGDHVTTEKEPETVNTNVESSTTPVAEEEDDDEDDDLGLLDIPDLPKSHGTAEYEEPKLLSKPVWSVAPEWTSPGFGEINVSNDPNSWTKSDYFKPDDPESGLSVVRTATHLADPAFATIDLDAPWTVKPRSNSRDSGKSEFETPQTYGSGDTRPTSIDDFDDYSDYDDERRSRSPPPRYRRYSHGQRSPRRESYNNQRRKKRRDRGDRGGRGGRNRDRRGPPSSQQLQGQKRKHKQEEERHGQSGSRTTEPQAKKHQADNTSPGKDHDVRSV